MHPPFARCSRALVMVVVIVAVSACSIGPRPPAAGVYAAPGVPDFDGLASEFKSTQVDVLFVTDRAPVEGDDQVQYYSHKRSRAVSYGRAVVELGSALSWDDLVAWSKREQRERTPGTPQLIAVEELGRLPPTPYPFSVNDRGEPVVNPFVLGLVDNAAESFRRELARRLALRQKKEVSIDVHGIQNTFSEWVTQIAVINHLFGRAYENIAYTWPAGGPGLLQAYAYDRESGEFTIFHLKQFIRFLAAMPEVEKIHLGAHSRGTDVVTSALRELIIETRAAGLNPREHLKFGNVTLLAADMNMEVASQRFIAEQLTPAFERVTVYANASDSAIGAARSLFGGGTRIGKLTIDDIDDLMRGQLRRVGNTDIILYKGRRGGGFRHSYYRSPAVMADMMLMYSGREPGAENGRPLKKVDEHIWTLDDDYLQEGS